MTRKQKMASSIPAYRGSRDLRQCGKFWSYASETIAEYPHCGETTWFETHIPGVIGLNGNHPGPGPAVIISDIEHAKIDILWSAGFTGCMGLAMLGKNDDGSMDAFFCHARAYDNERAFSDESNPMHLAKQFVDEHQKLRILWGTDFHFGNANHLDGQAARQRAQRWLSQQLGIWVRESDCVAYQKLCFIPKLKLLFAGSPNEAEQWVSSQNPQDLRDRIDFSNSQYLSEFTPDENIETRLQFHLEKLRMQKASKLRDYSQDGKRNHKITVLSQVLSAYRCGNFDVLRNFAMHARHNTSPFRDQAAKNTWQARGQSATAQLVIDAFDDALSQIRSQDDYGCGLREDGQNVFNAQEFAQVVAQDTSSSRNSNKAP